MADARLHVVVAGPYVSFQDGGRFGRLRFGVPASGPMDRLAHAAANVAVGNETDSTTIEVSVGGLVLECVSGATSVAVAGGAFVVDHDGARRPPWAVSTIRAGERIAIRAGEWGSWASVAFAGDLVVPRWLGHTATHTMSGFGGGSLASGQTLDVVGARPDGTRDGEIPFPEFARPTGHARVVMGPQDHHFRDEAITTFRATTYSLTDAYDRMGVRLSGAPLALRSSLSIPSEPIIRGSIQVAGDGVPTVLLADHQTTGGYPKIATVISSDLDRVAQLRAGDSVRFEPVTARAAIDTVRAHAGQVDRYLEQISKPGRTLTHRLMGENLISGAVAGDDDEPHR